MAAAEQIGGRRVWNIRHEFELLQRISHQREEDKYTDFTLKSKGKEFRVHRNVLAACSPYFDTLFQTNMVEQQSGTATLNFTSAEVLEELLAYMYSGALRIQEDTVEELLKTADHLLMTEVKELCIQYLLEQLDVSNCLAMKALAQVYKTDNLLQAANETIRKNIHAVIKREETLDIPLDSVQDLLADDLLQVAKEEELFSFLVAWTKRDLPARKDHFPTLFTHIRFTDIPKAYLEEFVKTEQLVRESEECQKYIATQTSSSEEESERLNARSGKMEEVVMVMGGVSRLPGNEDGTTEILCYLPRQNTWCQLCPLNYAVTFNAIAALNGKVYVAGGRLWPENRVTSFVSCFSVVENSWTRVRNMSAKRANFALVPCGGCLYAIGGKSERMFLGGSIGEVPVTTVERYNEANHTWSYIPSMNKVCSDVEAVATNDHIYLTFGKDGNGTNIAGNGQLPYYNVKTNVWGKLSATCPVSMNRGTDDENQVMVSYLRDNKIHFLGVLDSESSSPNGFYQYYDIAADQWTAVTISWPEGIRTGIILPGKTLYTPVHNGSIFICRAPHNMRISTDNYKTYYHGHMLTLKDKLKSLESTDTRIGVSSVRPAPTSSVCHLDIPQKHLSAFAKDVTMTVTVY